MLHPLFFTSGAARQVMVREDPATGQRIVDRSIVLSKYMNVPPARQLVLEGASESPVCTQSALVSSIKMYKHQLMAGSTYFTGP